MKVKAVSTEAAIFDFKYRRIKEKMSNSSWVFVLLLSLIAYPVSRPLFAEIIQLKNGNSLETKILKEDEKFVTVQAPGGRVKIPKGDIQTIWRGSKAELMEVKGREVFFAKGAEFYKEGKFLEAAGSFERALSGTALDAVIYANLASAYASAGEQQKAEESFLQAVQQNPGNSDVLLNAARFYESVKNFSLASRYYQKFLFSRPKDWAAQKSLAYCYYMQGEYQKASDIYEVLGAKNDPVSLCNAALCYLKLGNLDKAETILAAILEKKIPMSRPFLIRAEIYKRKKMFNEAEADYQRYIKIEKNNKEGLVGLGELYLQREENSRAEEQFTKVLAKDPQNISALYGLVQIAISRGEFGQAAGFYEKIIEKNKTDLSMLDNLGLLYLKMNEPKKALEIYQNLFAINDAYAKGHANAGLAYAFLGDADNALREWTRALELDPSMKEAAQNKKLLEDALQGSRDGQQSAV